MKKEVLETKESFLFRKAQPGDVSALQKLINQSAQDGEMLSRSLSELYDNIRDFHVCIAGKQVVGVCALHIVWEDLAEVKSLAVLPNFRQQGIGSRLARACLKEAEALKVGRVFTLTDKEGFFMKIGFKKADKNVLPQKVWGECVKCFKFPDCNEVAMIFELS
ncbi:MAG: N-acetyltransferase [Deltaproteobacteria bacterium]|nr:N-acetyltransferase [Deltaproteobacteria bacterium]